MQHVSYRPIYGAVPRAYKETWCVFLWELWERVNWSVIAKSNQEINREYASFCTFSTKERKLGLNWATKKLQELRCYVHQNIRFILKVFFFIIFFFSISKKFIVCDCFLGCWNTILYVTRDCPGTEVSTCSWVWFICYIYFIPMKGHCWLNLTFA